VLSGGAREKKQRARVLREVWSVLQM
jgi:hypothetical protein